MLLIPEFDIYLQKFRILIARSGLKTDKICVVRQAVIVHCERLAVRLLAFVLIDVYSDDHGACRKFRGLVLQETFVQLCVLTNLVADIQQPFIPIEVEEAQVSF